MSCGTCTLCCTLMGVEELKKPPCVSCKYDEGRCGIYASRPQSCRDFECMWLTSQATNSPWPKSMRPDKAGGLFIGSNVPDTLAVRLDPTRFANEKLMKYINNFVLSGVTVVIIKGDKQKVYPGIERKKPLPTDPV